MMIAPDVGLAVAALGREDFRGPPAGLDEAGDIGFLDLHEGLPVRGPAQNADRADVNARKGVDEKCGVGGVNDRVVGPAGRSGA